MKILQSKERLRIGTLRIETEFKNVRLDHDFCKISLANGLRSQDVFCIIEANTNGTPRNDSRFRLVADLPQNT